MNRDIIAVTPQGSISLGTPLLGNVHVKKDFRNIINRMRFARISRVTVKVNFIPVHIADLVLTGSNGQSTRVGFGVAIGPIEAIHVSIRDVPIHIRGFRVNFWIVVAL